MHVFHRRNLPFKAKVEFEPSRTFYKIPFIDLTMRRIRRLLVANINRIFNTTIPLSKAWAFSYIAHYSLSRKSTEGTYAGAFVGWDNTARKGIKSTIVLPATEDEFEEYLSEKIRIAKEIYKTNYLFINAWNEWAEGTYLEPDTSHQYSYLEVIKKICK